MLRSVILAAAVLSASAALISTKGENSEARDTALADGHGAGFAGEGRWLLITNTGADSVSIIDTETDEVMKTATVP